MASPTPLNPQQLAQMQQMQQQFAAEANRRGMTPQQFQEHQRQQLAADAAKQGLTPEQYINQLKARAMQQAQLQQQQQQQQQRSLQGRASGQEPGATLQQQVQQQIPVQPGVEPKPEALAVAKFLRSQDLKTRVCVLDGQRKDMFKGMDCLFCWSQTVKSEAAGGGGRGGAAGCKTEADLFLSHKNSQARIQSATVTRLR